jgi:DNA-binding GntR family transcriptional regulator
LYELRRLLETRLALEAARRMTLADLNALKVLNDDFFAALKSQSRPSLQEKTSASTFVRMELPGNRRPWISCACCGPNIRWKC